MYLRILRAALALSVVLAAAACDSTSNHALKLEASQAALTTTTNIETNIKNLSDVLQFLEDLALMQKGFHVAAGDMVCTSGAMFDPETGMPMEGEEETCEFEYSEEDLDVDMDQMAEDIVAKLNQYVFVASQIEEEAGTQVVYLLNPEIFCNLVSESDSPQAGIPTQGDSEYPMEEIDGEGSDFADCQELLQKVPVRLSFTSQAEGDIEVDVMLGEERAVALHLEFQTEVLALELDLGTLKQAVDVVNAAMGEEGDVPVQMLAYQGVVRAELRRLSADQFRMTFQIMEPIHEEVVLDGETFSLQLGSGTVTALADRAAKTVTLTSNLGAITAVFPYQMFIDAWYGAGESQTPERTPDPIRADDISDESEVPQVSGSMTLLLAGLSFQGTLAESNDTFSLSNIGFGAGTSSLTKDGETIVAVDLNADAGRAFDLVVAATEQDTVRVSVAPKFDLALAWALGKISADLDSTPEGMASETWRITLDGAVKPEIEILNGDNNDWIKVLAGQLTLSSTAALDQTVTTATGQCLSGEGDETDTPTIPVEPSDDISNAEHPFLSAFSAGVCQ